VFTGSFHGRTLGTLSLTKSKEVYTRRYPEISGIETVPFCEDRSCDSESCDCGFFTGTGSQLRVSLSPEGGYLDPEEIAFIALEPIQGVGGYRFPSEAFMQEIADVTEEYDIPLIVDGSSRAWAAPADLGLGPLLDRTRRHCQREGAPRRGDRLALGGLPRREEPPGVDVRRRRPFRVDDGRVHARGHRRTRPAR